MLELDCVFMFELWLQCCRSSPSTRSGCVVHALLSHIFSICQSSMTTDREQYTALVGINDETEWCRQGRTAGDYSLAVAVFQTIDEDVNRTNVRDSAERERIRRVLRAFALKNPSTGYCQVRIHRRDVCRPRQGSSRCCLYSHSKLSAQACIGCLLWLLELKFREFPKAHLPLHDRLVLALSSQSPRVQLNGTMHTFAFSCPCRG